MSSRHGPFRVHALAVIIIATVLMAACGSGSTSVAKYTPPLQSGTLDVGGVTRNYRTYYPPSLPDRPVPLLIALHGGQEYGDAMEQRTGFDSYAEADNFIVTYPNGHGQTWNSGACCGRPNVPESNEVAFIDALITHIASTHRIDTSRVYATGVSAGAAMAYGLACELSTRITAIASVAGTMALDTCQPQRPVSILEIHGTADPEVLYGGGDPSLTGGPLPSTPDISARWASLDSCTGSPATRTTGVVQVTQWTGCAGATSVQLEAIDGGGHVWFAPGLGPSDGAIDASQVIWQFLSHASRP